MKHSHRPNFYDASFPLSNKSPQSSTTAFDAIILGAGAAGLMCARSAASRGRRVALVDHNTLPGRKISVSGGGKANFTNRHMGSAFYVGEDPTFVEPALEAFPPLSILDLMTHHRLAWEEREHGQMFGLEPADTLAEALFADCRRLGCIFFLDRRIQSAGWHKDCFTISCTKGHPKVTQGAIEKLGALRAPSLVLALGSPAWPQVGGSDLGLKLAHQWGHERVPFRPVLTSLTMPTTWALRELAGISLKVRISTPSYTREDDMLFTHQGISGPAVLQISCRWHPGEALCIDFLPHEDFSQLLDAPECGKLLARSLLCRHLPQRLADALLPPELARRKVAELSRAARTTLRDCIHKHRVVPTGAGDLRKAEAAAGGVRTVDVNAWSMESLKQPGLFFAGELLDITGHLGGYNLHWAWASGYLAGLHL